MADVVIYNDIKQVLLLHKCTLAPLKSQNISDWFKKIERMEAVEEADAELVKIAREYNFI